MVLFKALKHILFTFSSTSNTNNVRNIMIRVKALQDDKRTNFFVKLAQKGTNIRSIKMSGLLIDSSIFHVVPHYNLTFLSLLPIQMVSDDGSSSKVRELGKFPDPWKLSYRERVANSIFI